jgi:hypothetical protein
MAKVSKIRPGLAQASHTALAEEFLADVHGLWQWHGRELLDRLSDERPEVIFKLMVRLAVVLHSRLRKPRHFDRRRIVRRHCIVWHPCLRHESASRVEVVVLSFQCRKQENAQRAVCGWLQN